MTQQSAVPTPSVMPQFKKPVIAHVNPTSDAVTYSVDDPRVVKAKRLVPGRQYQPFVHGAPRGTVRVVEAVTPNEDGSEWYVEFSTPHPAQSYKAAYRFWSVDADEPEATEVTEAPVAETPKPRRERLRPARPEHLTHQPFAGLADLLKEVQG